MDDYMSDEFVQNVSGSSHVDPRHDHPSWKRKADVERRTQEILDEQRDHSKKRMREVEQTMREQGLSAPIGRDNKGFAMLAKMGFSVGSGRGGLGKDSAQEQRAAIRSEMHALRKQATIAKHDAESLFRERQRARMNSKQILRDLHSAQRACEQLDEAMGLERSEMWTALPVSGADEEKDNIEGDDVLTAKGEAGDDFAALTVSRTTTRHTRPSVSPSECTLSSNLS